MTSSTTPSPVPWVSPTRHDAPDVPRTTDPERLAVDPTALANLLLAQSLREAIAGASFTSKRSLQVSIGASEIGGECPRQIAYRAVGTPAVNFPDPLKALVGIGTHHALADALLRHDGGAGRYLVEEPLEYRGIPGTCDWYYRPGRIAGDWKTTDKAKVAQVRRNGPPAKYVTQTMLYGAALVARGDPVDTVALVYVPTNGLLTDIYVWTAPFDQAAADRAVDAYEVIRAQALADGPDAVKPNPTRLCPWCAHYLPTSQDTARACPDGQHPTTTTRSSA